MVSFTVNLIAKPELALQRETDTEASGLLKSDNLYRSFSGHFNRVSIA